MSHVGTKRTNPADVMMSVVRGRPEVALQGRQVRVCGGFRLPECKSIHALRQPAAEKRQRTNPLRGSPLRGEQTIGADGVTR
jgi:hypothetical protein